MEEGLEELHRVNRLHAPQYYVYCMQIEDVTLSLYNRIQASAHLKEHSVNLVL